MEPAPVLVATLQIHVRRRPVIGPDAGLQHGGVADPRIEPDVEDVGFLLESAVSAVGADRPGRQQLSGLPLKPNVGTVLPDERHNMIQHGPGQQFPAAVATIENGDRDAPQTLAGNAPVRPVFHHAVDPVPSPGGNPLDFVDGF